MPGDFLRTKESLLDIISTSQTAEDLSHAQNTMGWVERINPEADEVLLLAGLGHDVERAMEDRYRSEMFDSYDEYKRAHAQRSGKIAASIALRFGYSEEDSNRLEQIIAEGEFPSEDDEVQLLCDADSISFFDNNISYYAEDKGPMWTRRKTEFMFNRASDRAKEYIRKIIREKPELDLINLDINDE